MWFIALLASCVVVLTAYALGSEWIAEASLGLPTGVWMVMLITGLTGLWATPGEPQSLHAPHDSATSLTPYEGLSATPVNAPEPVRLREPEAAVPEADVRLLVAARVPELSLVRDVPDATPTNRRAPVPARKRSLAAKPVTPLIAKHAASHVTPSSPTRIQETWPQDGVGRAARMLVRGIAAAADTMGLLPSSSVSAWLDRCPRPTKKLGIGLLAVDRASVFADARSPDTSIVQLNGGEPGALLEAHDLDVVISRGEQGLICTCREREGLDASWFDWGGTRPVSYFSVFPLRMDPKLVSISGILQDPTTVFRIARAAAAASRDHGRLNVYDRLRGRTPTTLPRSGCLDTLSGILLDLSRDLESATPGTAEGVVAARVASAFLATAAPALPIAERGAMLERAAMLAPGEPEVLLRLAAVRFAMLSDSLAMESLLRAERILRVSPTLQPTGVLPLIEAELEHGAFGELTVGRVAAGICLAAATTSPDRLTYLREDLFEDLRFSSWLVGRDPEHALLMDAFRQLERQRRADLTGLPEAKTKKSRKKKAA